MRLSLAAAVVVALSATAAASGAAPAAPARAARLAGPAVVPTAAAAATRATDATATGWLLTATAAGRKAARRDALYPRTSYASAAKGIATALARGTRVALPADGAPAAYLAGVASEATFELQVRVTIGEVVRAADAVVGYPLHTDAGWSVVSAPLAGGLVRYGVALVVGWPAPAVAANTGCAANGYCWSTRGLNPHLPWTRNAVTWYLSTANLPAAGESLVRTALATLNRTPGLGADLVYGGRTTDRVPTAAHRFLVVWGSGCTANALACTVDGTQGTYHLIYQARTVVTASRYAANPDRTWWTGTLMHEIAHATGLGHFDGTYLGRGQLMRWAGGPNTIEAGDANGLRRLAPPGRVTATVRARSAGNGRYQLVVRAANAGLGGLRSIRTDCLTNGHWVTVATAAGRFDGVSAERVVGTAAAGSTCRAVVRSKAAAYTSPAVTV
jgi:hypothetical protein